MWRNVWMSPKVWQKSNATDFFIYQSFYFFSIINVIPFKIISFGRYTPMETLFPLLVAALEIFNRYCLQHVRYTLLDVFLIKSSLKGSEKESITWYQTLQTNRRSTMTTSYDTLPSPSQNLWTQKTFLRFPSPLIHLTSTPVTFSFSLKMSTKDVISGL